MRLAAALETQCPPGRLPIDIVLPGQDMDSTGIGASLHLGSAETRPNEGFSRAKRMRR